MGFADKRAHALAAYAAALNVDTYMGNRCKHGHGRQRLASTGRCAVCERGRLDAALGRLSSPRQQALREGLRTYQGEPCRYGHDGQRRTDTGACVTCARIEAALRQGAGVAARLAIWRADHPGELKAQRRRYRARRKARESAAMHEQDRRTLADFDRSLRVESALCR